MKELSCSFCCKGRNNVKKLIAGPSVEGVATPYICDECIDLSHSVVHELVTPVVKNKPAGSESLSPEEIKEHLDSYVIGQDLAKTVLSVAIYNHYKRISNPGVNDTVLEKSNIMIMGPSGSGKTLLAKTVASLLDLPIVITDSTSFTESGYVGNDVSTIIDRLINEADGNIERAQTGIIFIDEIDKKTNKATTGSRDVSGEGVQQSLLKLVEGDIVQVPTQKTKKGLAEEYIDFDTTSVLFIVGGSFAGIEEIVRKRTATGSEIGLGATLVDKNDPVGLLHLVESEDLHEFGFIREFIGRFPIIVPFHNLDESLLVRIMKEPKNNLLSQYKTLFQIDGVLLEFDDNYVHSVAKQCMTRKTGARGLRTIIEKSLTSVQFVLPRLSKEGLKKVVIDKTGVAHYTFALPETTLKKGHTSGI